MKRYLVQMYSKSKLMMVYDFDTLEAGIANLDGYIDKLIIEDTSTEIEYVIKKSKKQG
jgi:hypothetical protein